MLDLLRRNRDFRLLYSAQIVSFLGNWFANVALIGLLLEETGSDAAAGAVFVAATLPTFLISPFAGAVVDHVDRRRLLVAASAASAVSALGFLLADGGRVWIGLAAQAALAALDAFTAPATSAAVPNVVDADDLPLASLMVGSTWGITLAVGAALGGLFAAVFGRSAAFVVDAGSFVVAAALVAGIRRPLREATPDPGRRLRPVRDMAEALRFARHRPDVLALLSSKAGFGLSAGIVALLAVFATGRFGAGDGGTGFLLAMRGVGVVLGPLAVRRFLRDWDGVGPLLLACGAAAVVYGAFYALVPVAPSLAVAGGLVLLAHLGGGAQFTLSTYGLQRATPDVLRGRVFAADFTLLTLSISTSFLLAGLASERVGPSAVTWVLSALSAAWGATYLTLTRRLRTPTSLAGPGPAPPRRSDPATGGRV